MTDSTNTQTAKKKINISSLLMSVIPLIMMIILITAAQIPAIIYGAYEQATAGDAFDPNKAIMYPGAQNLLAAGFIAYAVIMITVCTIWYKKAFLKKTVTITNKEVFAPKSIVIVLIGIFGAIGLVESYLLLLNMAAPSMIEQFNELMETSGIGNNPLTTIVYACILGPITEELVFRGLSMSYLRKANLPMFWVILIQAVYFGIAHMNLVQGSYAVILGVVIGLVRWKLGNVRIACLFHILYNTLATYGLQALDALNLPEAANIAVYIIFGLTGIGLIVYLLKQPERGVQMKVNA